MTSEICVEMTDPFDPDLHLVTIRPPGVEMPEGCVFMLAPNGEVVVELFSDGRVVLGEGISVEDAAAQFWLWVSTYAQGVW